jgi:hypothetical protein
MAIATCVKYLVVAAWIPSAGWLTFLAGFGALDVAQHYGKRITEHKPEEVARAEIIRKNGNGVSHETNMRSGGDDERG